MAELGNITTAHISLGELPTSYLESMTYAELLQWMCNYLDTEIYPAIEELQQYYSDLSEYIDEKIAECKQYTDNKLIEGKNYTDAEILELKNYVDGLIGDINAMLDVINGEVV